MGAAAGGHLAVINALAELRANIPATDIVSQRHRCFVT